MCLNDTNHKLLLKMKDSGKCAIVGVLLFFLPTGMAAPNGGSYVCKNTPWTYSEKVTIEFRVDRSKFPSSCPSSANSPPTFESSIDGIARYKSNCTVPTNITVCSFPPGALGCGCVNSDDNGFYVIQYNFIAHPDYNRWWRAQISCIDSNTLAPALNFTGTDCSNIAGVTPTPPPTTTPGTGHEDCRFCECDREECVLCCVLCILVIILCIIIFALSTTVFILCCCFPIFVKESAKKPDCKYCFCRALFALFGGCINWVISNGSASSPDGRNVTNDKETRMVLTGTSKREVESNRGADQDGGPSAPVTDREAKAGDKPDGTREKKKKKKNKQEKHEAEEDEMSPVPLSLTSSPEPTLVTQATSGRQLPQPYKAGSPETSTGREGAGGRQLEMTGNQTPSNVKGSRPLPRPFEGLGNDTTTTTPRPLAPIRNPPPSSMTSVERNSYAEAKGPGLPKV